MCANRYERVPSVTLWSDNWRACLLRAEAELGCLVTLSRIGCQLDARDWQTYWMARDAFYVAKSKAGDEVNRCVILADEFASWEGEIVRCESYIDYMVYAPSVADTHGCGGKHEE